MARLIHLVSTFIFKHSPEDNLDHLVSSKFTGFSCMVKEGEEKTPILWSAWLNGSEVAYRRKSLEGANKALTEAIIESNQFES